MENLNSYLVTVENQDGYFSETQIQAESLDAAKEMATEIVESEVLQDMGFEKENN